MKNADNMAIKDSCSENHVQNDRRADRESDQETCINRQDQKQERDEKSFPHASVLLAESIEALDIKPDGIYIDGTLGRAGHASEILKRIPDGHLYGFDLDAAAIEESQKKLEKISSNVTLFHTGYEHLKERLLQEGVAEIDGLFLDLGVSSPQFDDPARGFTYRADARLDMRMDQSQSLSAYEIINEYEEKELVRVFQEYGEEPFARKIARAIVQEREKKPIESTFELVDVIKSALPAKVLAKKGHPAKRIFQALRIEVNQELSQLESVLEQGLSLLKPGGRFVVLTFHSLEDRLVKKAFAKVSKPEKVDKRMPVLPDQQKPPAFRLVNRKPITAGEKELEENHRAHSAKLRAIEKIKEEK